MPLSGFPIAIGLVYFAADKLGNSQQAK